MSIKDITVAKKKPQDKDAEPKYEAQAVSNGEEDFEGMTRAVADRCTVTASDSKAVLDAFQTIMIQRLSNGQIVRLNDLGSFRMSLSSEGTSKESEINAAKIKKARIIFVPSAKLKEMCKAASFTKVSATTRTAIEKEESGNSGDVLDPTV